MLVVAIIGILAAVALPNFIRFQAKGKQSEAGINLKAVFTAQKASFSHLNGFWSDVSAIGFSVERGNRYLYDLGPTSTTVEGGSEGTCGNLVVDRTMVAVGVMAGDCGYSADTVKHGDTFDAMTLRALAEADRLPLSLMSQVGLNADLMAAGVNGMDCPNCDFAAVAISNIDNDPGADVWWISSQTIETPDIVGCPPGRTVMAGNAFPGGSPVPVVNDVCFESM
ncbi:MAG: hypothetical protein INH41_11770 [Myxococcaceae bacterium]|nr:hypothetical protein [Myxococcaceae bacterium]MCA3013061.1 hypothetical protein [Myxococcaceae bacterium]